MIAFALYKLHVSPLALCRLLASAHRQSLPANPRKNPRAQHQVADSKSIIADDPGSIVIFLPEMHGAAGRIRACGPSLLGRRGGVGRSAAGDRVGVLAARRQAMLLPAAAAVSSAEDLAAPGDAIDLVGVARMEGDTHHRRLGLEAVVEALPAAAEILAPK